MHDHKLTNNYFQISGELLVLEDSVHTLHWSQNCSVSGRVYPYGLFQATGSLQADKAVRRAHQVSP